MIAFGLLEGMVPHNSEVDKHAAANKMLYVICSRAKKNLHLISEAGRMNYRRDPYYPTDVLLACTHAYDLVP